MKYLKELSQVLPLLTVFAVVAGYAEIMLNKDSQYIYRYLQFNDYIEYFAGYLLKLLLSITSGFLILAAVKKAYLGGVVNLSELTIDKQGRNSFIGATSVLVLLITQDFEVLKSMSPAYIIIFQIILCAFVSFFFVKSLFIYYLCKKNQLAKSEVLFLFTLLFLCLLPVSIRLEKKYRHNYSIITPQTIIGLNDSTEVIYKSSSYTFIKMVRTEADLIMIIKNDTIKGFKLNK